MKWLVYIRISKPPKKDRQKHVGEDGDNSLGMKVQREACLKYIENHEIKGEIVYFEDKGLSGDLEEHKRPALYQAMKSAKKGDIFLAHKRERVGRNNVVITLIERQFLKKNCRFITVENPGGEGDDPLAIFINQILDAVAQFELGKIGQRTKEGLAQKSIRNERVGAIPYGFSLHEDGIHLILNEYEQEVFRLICSLKTQQMSYNMIREELIVRDVRNREDKPWSRSAIARLCQTESDKNNRVKTLLK